MNCPYCQGEGEIQNRYGPGYVQCRYCGGYGEIWPSDEMTCYETCTDPQCAECEKLPSEKFEAEPFQSYVGRTLAFMFRGAMTPFRVDRDHGDGTLKLVSLDLKWTARILKDTWDKQAAILSAAERTCDNCGNLLPRGCRVACGVCGYRGEC